MKRLAIALMLLGGCGDGRAPDDDGRLKSYGQDQVRKLLREPDKARFTSVRISRKSGLTAICGYVSTPTTDIQRFVSGGATTLEENMAPGAMGEVWSKLC